MVAVSFSPNVPRGSIEITRFVEVLHAAQSVRRLGSAALNLCYIAAGRLDVTGPPASARGTWPPGVLVVREAGGVVTDIRGTPLEIDRPEMLRVQRAGTSLEVLTLLSQVEQAHMVKGPP